jgi:hypothetical protein
MAKDSSVIYFEELPRNLQHALEVLMEWHSVLVYEIEQDIYGFYILDEHMPGGLKMTGLIDSKYVHSNDGFIQESVQNIIDTKFKRKRCKYFPKGCLSIESMRISPVLIYRSGPRQTHLFSIEVHSNDYGFIDSERSKIAPAFAHVLDKDNIEIGLLDITGPCPNNISDIKEFRSPHEFGELKPMKITPLAKYKKELVKWANSLRQDQKYWEWAQEVWKIGHIDTR